MKRQASIAHLLLTAIFLFGLLFGGTGVRTAQAAPPTDLFFSEYVEGTSNNKALEIYNGTGAAINLNAGEYHIMMYFNGNPASTLNIPLSGTIAAGDVYVLAHSSASPPLLALADTATSGSWFSGDDVVELRKGPYPGVLIDSIGQVGVDPGTEWGSGLVSTADNTLRRKSTVCQGDLIGSNPFDPSLEWDGYAMDTFDGLGVHAANCSGVEDTPPSVSSVTPAQNADNVAVDANLTVNFSEAVSVAGAWFELSCSLSGDHTAAVTGGPGSYTLNPAVDFANDEECTVTIFAAQVSDLDLPIDPMADDFSWSFHTAPSDDCGAASTPIFAIQGSGLSTPLLGSTVRLEGVVTADFQGPGQLSGFYVQDLDGDANLATSDGVFVYHTATDVSVGDRVRVRGVAAEYNGQTEISPVSLVTICGTRSVPPVIVDLPVVSLSDWERYEGMIVAFPEELTVTDNYDLARYGEFSVSADGRLLQPTNADPPGSQELNDRRLLLVDDASTASNLTLPPYLNAGDTLRLGTTVTGLTGVVGYGFGAYRLQPTQPPAFVEANPRPSAPALGGSLKVAGLNVHNYFNGDGQGGGFPAPRGAETYEAFLLQRAKVITTVLAVDADVVGLMEIENDGGGPLSAIQDLVDGLNAAAGDGAYAFVPDPSPIGSDEIKVALVYKPARVTLIGASSSDSDPIFSRPPVAQTFEVAETGARMSVVANHFKSKGCGGATGLDADQGDGQGCYNNRRQQQAAALLDFISSLQTSSGDQDVLVIGDLNAYGAEDPIDDLEAGGLVDQIAARIPAAGRYSYLFDGQTGYLDHALTTGSLGEQVADVAIWHINSDEPAFLDFASGIHYSPTPYRSSDHDPVLISFNLGLTAGFTGNSPILPGETAIFTNTTAGLGPITYAWDFGDGSAPVTGASPTHVYSAPGDFTVTLTATSPSDTSVFTEPFVVAEPLNARFTSNSPVALGQAAVFTNTTTGFGPISYQWDFGDGSAPVSNASPTHTYATIGAFTVTLTATNSLQQDVFSGQFVVVGSLAAGFSSNSPILPGETGVFTNTTAGLGPITYEWDFGDGCLPVYDVTPTHIYAAPGNFTVILTAASASESSVFAEPFLVAEPLNAAFASSSPALLGETAVFTNTTTGYGPITYEWDFGDGTAPASDEHPAHTYPTVGEFTVTLTATNALQQDVFSDRFIVVEPLSPGFTSNSPVRLGEPVVFTNTTTGYGPITYAWDFGDGSAPSDEGNPQHTYAAPGVYTVTLAAANELESQSFTDTVEVLLPALQFQAGMIEVAEGNVTATLTVTLSASSPHDVEVDLLVTGTASAGQDYTFDPVNPLVIPAGQTMAQVEVAILDDLLDEPVETVLLALANPAGAELGAPAQAAIRILDDDGQPYVFFDAQEFAAVESEGSAGFVVRLDAPSSFTVTVAYAASDGTASAGRDYTAGSGLLTFAPGEQAAQAALPLIDDALDEPIETILLALSAPISATLGDPAAAIISIADDDPPAPPEVRLFLPLAIYLTPAQ